MVEILLQVIQLALVALIPILVTTLNNLMNKYVTNLIETKTHGETEDMLKHALSVITDSVNYVQQTYVDTLKETDSFSIENQQEALELAKQRAENLMGEAMQSAIEAVYGNKDNYVETVIESLINQQ